MVGVLADLSFLALIAVSWTILYREYLPRLLAQERRLRVTTPHAGPGLSGRRYLAWIVATTLAVLPLAVGYHLLRKSHPPSLVAVLVGLLSWACIFSGHRFHRDSEAERVPEARFGAFIGSCLAVLLYAVLASTVLP